MFGKHGSAAPPSTTPTHSPPYQGDHHPTPILAENGDLYGVGCGQPWIVDNSRIVAPGWQDARMSERVTRQAASDAVGGLGWRYMLGTLRASAPVGSLFQAVSVAAHAVAACGEQADEHLRADLRVDQVVLTLQTRKLRTVTAADVELAKRISASGVQTEPGELQLLEIAIDAMDIAAVRPFWSAVLGYAEGGPGEPLTDPAGQGPVVWFQQMDEARPQRNRIHVDIAVAHDEAPLRVEAALKAGGRVVSGARAPSFWVLADPEGNEACVSTWQGRD